MIHLGSEQKASADLKTQVLGAVLLLNWTVIQCHVEYVGGSGNVCTSNFTSLKCILTLFAQLFTVSRSSWRAPQ